MSSTHASATSWIRLLQMVERHGHATSHNSEVSNSHPSDLVIPPLLAVAELASLHVAA